MPRRFEFSDPNLEPEQQPENPGLIAEGQNAAEAFVAPEKRDDLRMKIIADFYDISGQSMENTFAGLSDEKFNKLITLKERVNTEDDPEGNMYKVMYLHLYGYNTMGIVKALNLRNTYVLGCIALNEEGKTLRGLSNDEVIKAGEENCKDLISQARTFDELYDVLEIIDTINTSNGEVTARAIIEDIKAIASKPVPNPDDAKYFTRTYGLRAKVMDLIAEKNAHKFN